MKKLHSKFKRMVSVVFGLKNDENDERKEEQPTSSLPVPTPKPKTRKREPRYFKIIGTSSPKVGMLFGPKNVEWNSIVDAEPFEKKEMEVELPKGQFPDYVESSKCVRIVSPAMKRLFEEYNPDRSALEFFPIKVVSKEYGDRIHYIMHFNKIYDVLNPDCSIYVEGGGSRSITIPGIDLAKAEGLHLFNLRPITQETVVSDELRRAINRNKLNLGIMFLELPRAYRRTGE